MTYNDNPTTFWCITSEQWKLKDIDWKPINETVSAFAVSYTFDHHPARPSRQTLNCYTLSPATRWWEWACLGASALFILWECFK